MLRNVAEAEAEARLAARAIEEELVLVTRDPAFRKYGVRTLW